MDHTASSTMDPFCTRLTNRIIFPNPESCLRLIRALCSEVHDQWVSGKRYLDMTGEKPEKKRSMAVA